MLNQWVRVQQWDDSTVTEFVQVQTIGGDREIRLRSAEGDWVVGLEIHEGRPRLLIHPKGVKGFPQDDPIIVDLLPNLGEVSS